MTNKFLYLYRRLFWSHEKQAKHAGVKLGKGNFIDSHFWTSEAYLITIGNYCQITKGTKFFTHGGAGALRYKYPNFDLFGKISVGDYVYFGNNSMIMPGVKIGNHVLIAAGSVVTKSIPNNCVVAGNPARFICTLDEYAERNLKYNLDSYGYNATKKKKLLLSLPEEKFIHKKELSI